MILGTQLINTEDVSEGLITAIIERIAELDAKDPALASLLRRIIQNWKGAAINALMLKDLKAGRTNLNAILKLLSMRRELREKQTDHLFDVRGGSPAAGGISACLLENAHEYEAILSSENPEAKIALLGCARLIRAELPVPKVAENLKSANKLLALAAERYLESEDSPDARRIVLALHPNEAKILGAKTSFIADEKVTVYGEDLQALFGSVNPIFKTMPPYLFVSGAAINLSDDEKSLRQEVKENQELLGIYSYHDNFIRIYADKAVFSWQTDPARYQERTLFGPEFDNLKDYLAAHGVDGLPPFLSPCGECQAKQLLMIGRGGGRRVFLRAGQTPQFFAGLEEIFAGLRRPASKLRYRLENKIQGLEILWADENLPARNLWKNGADLRLLIEDVPRGRQIERELAETRRNQTASLESEGEETEEGAPAAESQKQKRLARRKYESFAWYRLDRDKLADPTLQPPLIEQIPPFDNFPVPAVHGWKSRTTNVEIRADEEGLYKISSGQFSKLRSGYYENPLVTPNGRWALAAKYASEESAGEYGAALVRINLLTGKEFKLKFPAYPSYEPIAFLPALNKVLVFGGYYSDEEESGTRTGDYYLLDPETGAAQKIKGEFRPLTQQTFRPLQPALNGSETFWAAIPDPEKNETAVGFYQAKTMSFKPLITLPQIIFDSMALWVDEAENKMYFIYEGHLLSLPLPKKP
jgi:hypothetical protein